MKIKNLFQNLVLLALLTQQAAAQTIQTPFGKNRVQYHRQFDDWLYYESPNFTTYWYGAARNVGQAAVQMAEFDLAEVQQLLEYPITDKIEVIVFSDLTDLKQSNIGTDELFLTRTGQTKVIGNKVFAYFDGNHHHLRAQIREGVAAVIINAMLYGANLQEIVQNAVLLNLPGWFIEGLAAYAGEAWSDKTDDELRDILLSGKFKSFDKLAKNHPRLAGQAFWYYVGLHFGKGTISNLLYLTRINRSVDQGFLYVLGTGYKRTGEALMEYFNKRYRDEASQMRPPERADAFNFKNKKRLPISQVKINPDGRRLAWATNDIGKWRIYLEDLKSGKRRVVLRGGSRDALQATDFNYPLLAWSPDNQRLAVAYERRDVTRMTILEAENPKKKEHFIFPAEFQRLYSMDFSSGSDLVFSAAQHGFSDLFLYHTATKSSERLTQDFWDDLDAAVVRLDDRPGILFSSNRLSDTLAPQRLDSVLPLSRFDIFYYDLTTRSPELVRVTRTPSADERCPAAVDSAFFTFISHESGIGNQQLGFLEPYTAFFQKRFFLKDGSEARGLLPEMGGEWTFARAAALVAPVDSVLKNLDSLQIDSFRIERVQKRRGFTFNQTNFDRNLLELHTAPRVQKQVELIFRNARPEIFISKISTKNALSARLTRHRELVLRELGQAISQKFLAKDSISQIADAKDLPKIEPERRDTATPIQPGWLFQMPDRWAQNPPAKTKEPARRDEKIEEENFQTMEVIRVQPEAKKSIFSNEKPGILRFNQSRIIPYRLKFRTDYFSTTMDNSLLFDGLDSYAGTPQALNPQPVGLLAKANFKDLMEDYVIEMGARLPVTFNGAEYYLFFDNKKKRLDRRIALYRKTLVNDLSQTARVRNNTLLGQYEIRYPLSHFFSLRAVGTLRQDVARPLSTDRASLEAPAVAEQRIGVKISAVFDNTVQLDLNLMSGTRAKIWSETVKRFEFNTRPSWDLKFNSGLMQIIGLDARHYLRLDRRSILAMRLCAMTSFGSERILYFLGGEENEIIPKFNNRIPVPQSGNFAFQTLAPHLRGFQRNIRNGNSFALLNSEIRFPVFKYFSRKPTMSSFWRNFQLVGFFDAGTAWQGKNPYSGENPLNTVYLFNPPTVAVKVNYFRDPLVAGYGGGVRLTLFGMFLRVNYGWGIETRVVQDPVWHFSLGTDF